MSGVGWKTLGLGVFVRLFMLWTCTDWALAATYSVTVNPVPTHGNVTISPLGINCGTLGATCSATTSNGTSLTITATPDTGYSFRQWAVGAGTSTLNPVTVTMPPASQTVAATFDPQLSVNRVGTGTGTVSAPGYISCGSTCASGVPTGTTVALTATASTGSAFSGWSGPCTGTANPCNVTVNTPQAVTATFTARYDLTVSAANGTVTSDIGGINCGAACSATYDSGTVVALTATPASGYAFTGWSGACSGSVNPCNVTMDAAKTVAASFARYTLTVTPPSNGTVTANSGGINCGITCSAVYDVGTVVALTANPASGYVFTGWSGACSGSANPCNVAMDAAKTVAATFALNYPLTINISPTLVLGGVPGTVSGDVNCSAATCASNHVPGSTVSLTATPQSGYRFAGWSGACTGTANPCVVGMTSTKSVTATFIAIYALTVTQPNGGGVTNADWSLNCGWTCSASFDSGTVVTLTATPDTGYSFMGWSGACSGTAFTCTVTMDGAKTVAASFLPKAVLTLVISNNAQITYSTTPAVTFNCVGLTCAAMFEPGAQSITLNSVPLPGYAHTEWIGACAGAGPTCQLTMDADKSTEALYVQEGVGAIGSTPLNMSSRLTANGVPSGCAPTKTYPGSTSVSAPFVYGRTYLYNNGPERCITVRYDPGTCGAGYILSAYAYSFNAADLAQNYLGDAGQSYASGSHAFSFIAPANATVALVAQGMDTSSAVPCQFTWSSTRLVGRYANAIAAATDGDAKFALGSSPFDTTPGADFKGVSATLTTDHVFESGWWYRIAGDASETYFPTPDSQTYTGSTITLAWNNLNSRGLLKGELVWTVQDLDGVGGTQPSGRVTGKLKLSNISGAAVTVNLFHALDADVGNASTNNAALNVAGGIDITGNGSTLSYSAPGANNYLVREFATSTDVFGLLSDAAPNDFDSTTLPFTGDFTGGWQWRDRVIPAGGSITVTAQIAVNATQVFTDVPATSFANNSISAIRADGITTGCVAGVQYCPSDYVTREQMAAFLVRAVEGEPAANYCDGGIVFSDVSTGSTFCKYIKRLYELGITTGCVPGSQYCPSGNVTREQMAAFIVRAVEGNPGATYCGASQPFGDVATSSGFCGHIKRLAELAITTGCGGGNYCPGDYVTREQMAAFLARAFLGM